MTTYSLQLDHDVTHIERVDDLISELVHLATQIDKPQGELHTARSRMSSAARVVSRAESRVIQGHGAPWHSAGRRAWRTLWRCRWQARRCRRPAAC